MKRTIVLLAVIIIMLIAAIPVFAQTDGETAYPPPEPQPGCCYDALGIIIDSPEICDAYYEANPDAFFDECPDYYDKQKDTAWKNFVKWFRNLLDKILDLFQ